MRDHIGSSKAAVREPPVELRDRRGRLCYAVPPNRFPLWWRPPDWHGKTGAG
ncbi:hypothetical protein AZA_61577 [Nitrospirillum viridazoti Y2]|nr:hypothetical protein AZA_61577 [Nitrospirillum amazonense Y2]